MSDLDRLTHEGHSIDQAAAAEEYQADQQAEQSISLNESFRPRIVQFLGFAVGLTAKAVPFAPSYFDDNTIKGIADAVINVADVEGVDLNAMLGNPNSRMGAWIGLAVAVGFPSFMFYLAFLEYRKTQPTKAPAEKEVKDAEHKPASDGFHG